MRVTFLGAAGEVTGSCHLVETGRYRILLDCGLYQGGREEYRRNAAAFEFEPHRIDAVVLTHAHIDHCGRLPLLVRRGFEGPIHAHPATCELAAVMLEDSLRLALADVERRNRRRARQGLAPLAPLYGPEDVARVLRLLRPLDYGIAREILPDVRVWLSDAGHILGAAIVELESRADGPPRTLVHSGDIGPVGAPIMRDPTPVASGDLLLLESTYGDRLHRTRESTVAELGQIFEEAARERGMILIPAFAVGRTQEILYWLAEHYDAWGLRRWQIVLDSPMAAKVIEIYGRHRALFDAAGRRAWNGNRNPFQLPGFRLVETQRDSMRFNDREGGAVIIAGSGMCNGGRIVHHLRHHVWRRSTHVVIPGYQAEGTLGRQLVDGATKIRIHGEPIAVRARVHTIGGLSAHADQQGLADWCAHFARLPPVWLVHGEDRARLPLADALRARFGAEVGLSRPGLTVEVPARG
jgi:metallo-beta-lactamase family protein